MAEATDTVIIASVIVAGTTLIRDVHEGKRRAAPIVFGFLMAVALLIIAIPAPKFAKGLSYFAMVGAFVVNGPAIFAIASKISQGKQATVFKAPVVTPPGSMKGPIGVDATYA